MKNERNVLQITLKKQKVRKTKFGRFFQRLEFKIYDIKIKFKAWFFRSIIKLMRWLAPKEVVEKWDAEWEEEMKDATIQIVSQLDPEKNKALKNAIQEGIDSEIAEDFDPEQKKIFTEFSEKVFKNTKYLDPDINEMLNDKFSDLFDDENENIKNKNNESI